MELREAIEEIRNPSLNASNRMTAYEVCLNAIIDGTLTPADQAVKVKPLEWKDGCARTLVGTYSIHQTHTLQSWYALRDGSGVGDPYVKTEDEAKAAAQADYEKRIRSTLIPADELPTDDTDELINIAYLKGVADGKDQAAEKAILDLIIDTPQPKGGDDE